jgi:thioredoxin 1
VDVRVSHDDLPLLVFFRSERSGPARRMESLLAHLARKERARLRVRCVDVDRHSDLADRFEVTEIPTLLLVKDQRVVERLEGRASAPAIERMLEPHLEPLVVAA